MQFIHILLVAILSVLGLVPHTLPDNDSPATTPPPSIAQITVGTRDQLPPGLSTAPLQPDIYNESSTTISSLIAVDHFSTNDTAALRTLIAGGTDNSKVEVFPRAQWRNYYAFVATRDSDIGLHYFSVKTAHGFKILFSYQSDFSCADLTHHPVPRQILPTCLSATSYDELDNWIKPVM